jgi:nucleoside-diphosphate-sugar epimerase
MGSDRIVVFGASGFVGSALCERLIYEDNRDFRACIHSTGNCWRLIRFPLPLEVVDICDADAVAGAMRGCSVVVNCTRGDARIMSQGLQTLLKVARDSHVRKFIHPFSARRALCSTLSGVACQPSPAAEGSARSGGAQPSV